MPDVPRPAYRYLGNQALAEFVGNPTSKWKQLKGDPARIAAVKKVEEDGKSTSSGAAQFASNPWPSSTKETP